MFQQENINFVNEAIVGQVLKEIWIMNLKTSNPKDSWDVTLSTSFWKII